MGHENRANHTVHGPLKFLRFLLQLSGWGGVRGQKEKGQPTKIVEKANIIRASSSKTTINLPCPGRVNVTVLIINNVLGRPGPHSSFHASVLMFDMCVSLQNVENT